MKEQIVKNLDWLQTLTQPQLRALACQRGVCDWKTVPVKTIMNTLSIMLDIQEPVRG